MRKLFITATLLVPVAAALGFGGCLLEDREVEIILNDEHCVEFVEYHTIENYTTPVIIEIGEDLDSLLVDNEVSRDQIVDAFLVSGFYEVKEFSHTHNWVIRGVITVERLDITGVGPDTLIVYSDISLEDELGVKTKVDLHKDGVAIVKQAMDDYILGGHPTLQLMVLSGEVEPPPSGDDPLDFMWEACLNIQVIVRMEAETVDPL